MCLNVQYLVFLKHITLIFNKIFDFFIILILMAEGFCLGARAGKAVALPIQNEFLRYFKNNTLILFKTAIFRFKINISTFQN